MIGKVMILSAFLSLGIGLTFIGAYARSFQPSPIPEATRLGKSAQTGGTGGACVTEKDDLQHLAESVRANIDAPAEMRAGGVFEFSWQAPERFPSTTPVYLILAIPGNVRFLAKPPGKQAPFQLRSATAGHR